MDTTAPSILVNVPAGQFEVLYRVDLGELMIIALLMLFFTIFLYRFVRGL